MRPASLRYSNGCHDDAAVQVTGEQRSSSERHPPTPAPLLTLELRPDGVVTAIGQHSMIASRGAEPRPDSRPLDRLNASGTASWHWDGQQLLARTSDTGLLPIYYHAEENRITLSTSLLALRERMIDARLDWPAIAIQLAFGGFIEDDTPYVEIKALPLRTTLAWSRDRLVIEQRTFEIPQLTLDYDEAKRRYLSTFREAVQRTLPIEGFALGLSGGRDSRHILLQLLELGIEPTQLTTSSHCLRASDPDTMGATMIAERAGFPITLVEPDPDRIRSELRKNELTEFASLAHSWGLQLGSAFTGQPVLYDGMNGGALFGRAPFVSTLSDASGRPPHDIPGLAAAVIERWFDRVIGRIEALFVASPLPESVLEEARQRIETAMWNYEHAPSPAKAFHYFNHTGRTIGAFTYGLMNTDSVLCPFDDPEVVRLGLGLPWPVSHNPRLQTEAIRDAFMQYADIPFAEEITGAASSTHWDREAESETAAGILDERERLSLPALEPHAAERYASGEAPLPEVQAITYLTQLVCEDAALDR